MKRLLYIPLLLILLLGCKSNENDSATPQSLVTSLSGKWLMTETEVTVNGKKVWQVVNTLTPVYLIFRSDGVMLDGDGKASCCGPNALSINGNFFKIEPQSEVTYSLDCAAVDCLACPVLDIEYSGNQMIITYCIGGRVKYIKN
ncbi:hypothetical protein [Dyadobacter frigoris]|uniref:Lipocalin-like domain-containing protein n=1 Tax=Dyadobacter frigoris TaxID=2576211 RepID=A0A4U6D505_9BACT|nr:hypothetical protein [Dyadobacter frigoris]TKT91495.1 hypothetical protein FDK13_14070 [Dyadobacter frigoris]GLU51948.1 hypothetical protein Dfri01_14090 [Dyadobacter frigoris]